MNQQRITNTLGRFGAAKGCTISEQAQRGRRDAVG